MSQYNHVSYSWVFDPVYVLLWTHQRNSTSMDWSIHLCIQKLLFCWRCKDTFEMIPDPVNSVWITSAMKCVCGFWLASIIVPCGSKCKIILQFRQKQWRQLAFPAQMMVVLAWGLQSNFTGLSWQKNRKIGCIGSKGSSSQRCPNSERSSYRQHSARHLNCKKVVASHQSLAPRAKSWQGQESWMLFCKKCLPTNSH